MTVVQDFGVNDVKPSDQYDHFTSPEKRSGCSRRTLLLSLSYLVLLLTAAAFFAAFLVYYFKYEGRDVTRVCTDVECIKTASMMARKMDASMDPCEDFNNFACGNFYKVARIDDDEMALDTLSSLNDGTSHVLKAILMEEIKDGDWDYVVNMKTLYQSCMDEERIEAIGLQPYLDSPQAQEWPMRIGADWTQGDDFDLNDVITRYMEIAVEPLFSYHIIPDPMNTSRSILEVNEPGLGLSREYLLMPRNNGILKTYEVYLTNITIALGADRAVAARDVNAVIDLEVELAKIKASKEDKKNILDQYNPTTLGELGRNYSYIDIPRAIRAPFALANVTLDDDQVVNVPHLAFFEKLQAVLEKTDSRTLMNKFGLTYAMRQTRELTPTLQYIRLQYLQDMSGVSQLPPRWETCLATASAVFDMPLAKEYTRRTFSEDSKEYINTMVTHLEESVREILRDAAWMSDETRAEAYAKLEKMSRKIGYPDTKFEHEDLEEQHKNLTMSINNFYENMEIVFWTTYLRSLKVLKKPVDKDKWAMAPFETNAYYHIADNEVVFLAGLLQAPLYSKVFPDSLNYGAIGAMIGHEITHGFDDEGRLFDKNGTFRDWWQEEDMAKFKEKSQCFVEQYGNFRDDVVGMNVSGINTLSENVADNGGLEASYSAYRKLVRKKGKGPMLPGLDLTHDQLFFLGFAQTYCEKMTRESAYMDLMFDEHAPGRFRTLGSLQNSVDFAEAYNCPVSSPMNPEKKCSVW